MVACDGPCFWLSDEKIRSEFERTARAFPFLGAKRQEGVKRAIFWLSVIGNFRPQHDLFGLVVFPHLTPCVRLSPYTALHRNFSELTD